MKKFVSLKEAYIYYHSEEGQREMNLSEAASSSEFSAFLAKGLSRTLLKGYEEASGLFESCLDTTQSDQYRETYNNLGSISTPKKRIHETGEFERGWFESESIAVINSEYGQLFEISKFLIENDQTRTIESLPTRVGQSHARNKDELCGAFYNNGDTETIYDAALRFAVVGSGHPNISGAAVNPDNTNDCATGAISQSNLESVLVTMGLWKGLMGEWVRLPAIRLIVSLNQQYDAERILQSTFDTTAGTGHVRNVLANRMELIVNPYLTNDTYYVKTNWPGAIIQSRLPIELLVENEAAGESFEKRLYRFRSYECFGGPTSIDWRAICKGN